MKIGDIVQTVLAFNKSPLDNLFLLHKIGTIIGIEVEEEVTYYIVRIETFATAGDFPFLEEELMLVTEAIDFD